MCVWGGGGAKKISYFGEICFVEALQTWHIFKWTPTKLQIGTYWFPWPPPTLAQNIFSSPVYYTCICFWVLMKRSSTVADKMPDPPGHKLRMLPYKYKLALESSPTPIYICILFLYLILSRGGLGHQKWFSWGSSNIQQYII